MFLAAVLTIASPEEISKEVSSCALALSSSILSVSFIKEKNQEALLKSVAETETQTKESLI